MGTIETATQLGREGDGRSVLRAHRSLIAILAMAVAAAGLTWVWYQPRLLGFQPGLSVSDPSGSTQGDGDHDSAVDPGIRMTQATDVAATSGTPATTTDLSEFAALHDQKQRDPLMSYADQTAPAPLSSDVRRRQDEIGRIVGKAVTAPKYEETEAKKPMATEEQRRRQTLRDLVGRAPPVGDRGDAYLSTLQEEGLRTVVVLEAPTPQPEGATRSQAADDVQLFGELLGQLGPDGRLARDSEVSTIPVQQGSEKTSATFVCTSGNLTRRIVVEAPSSDPTLACRVVYESEEGSSIPWFARYEPTFCQKKATAFVAQHRAQGWTCLVQ